MRAAFRHLSPANLLLTPVKQHLGCCVAIPLFLKMAGAGALAEIVTKREDLELAFLMIALPPVVWLILKLEDIWRGRHAAGHEAAADSCAGHCHPKQQSFIYRYVINLGVAALIAWAVHALFHRHH